MPRPPSKRPRATASDAAAPATASSSGSTPAEWPSNIPKAIVSESNGEISASVEETNRIRALLGMKPLNVSVAKAGGGRRGTAGGAQDGEEEEEKLRRKARIAELEKRIQRAKRKRKKRAGSRLEGKGLGDELKESVGDLSAAEWIQRNRQKTKEEQKLMAEKTRLKLLEQEKLAAAPLQEDLRGMGVRHGVEAFQAGREVVLTLADQSVLDEGRQDVLQNETIADRERAEELVRIKKKSLLPVYEGTDDHEFEGVIGEKRILQQYDEERDSKGRVDEHQKKLKTAFTLDGSATLSVDQAKAETKPRFKDDHKPQESLMQTVQATKIQEYYTKDELVGFKKKKKKKRRKKKGNSSNSAAEGEAAPGNGEAEDGKRRRRKKRTRKASSIVDELEELAAAQTQPEDADIGSRKGSRVLREKMDMAKQQAAKAAAFQTALDSANADRSIYLTKAPPPPPMLEDEEDPELARAVLRSQALSQAPQQEGEDLIAIAEANRRAAREEAEQRAAAQSVDGNAGDEKQSLVFNATSEFSLRIQKQLQERVAAQNEARLAELKRKTQSLVQEQKELAAKQLRSAQAKAAESDSDSDDGAGAAIGPSMEGQAEAEQQKKKAELSFMRNEVLHSSGIAATLQMMRRMGHDRKAKKDVTFAGRTNDPKSESDAETDRVKLVYKDKYGRRLTRKEAFRQHSYSFHGIKPSRKKMEKTLRKFREEMALKKNKNSGMRMMDRIKKAQAKTGQAHVILPGLK